MPEIMKYERTEDCTKEHLVINRKKNQSSDCLFIAHFQSSNYADYHRFIYLAIIMRISTAFNSMIFKLHGTCLSSSVSINAELLPKSHNIYVYISATSGKSYEHCGWEPVSIFTRC